MLIRSASGLRGIVKDDFSPAMIDQYIASFISNQNITSCVIGRDGRPSGKEISQWVIDALTKYGVNVDNCDLATTPTIQLMTEKDKYDGGIVITASHNPTEYNGLKFLQKNGTFLSPDQCNTLFLSVDSKIVLNKAEVIGKVSAYSSGNEEHIAKVFSAKCIQSDAIRSKNFKVVIDAVNGGGSTILPQLCKDLGCDITTINCNGDGNFTRVAEPLSSSLNDLEKKVVEVGADIGFATDPDGDRLSIVSNKGVAIGEEYTLALATMNYCSGIDGKEVLVTNLSTSQLTEDVVNASNNVLLRSKIGEANVVELMEKNNANMGGEGNGGVILREVHLGRDSAVAIGMILNLLTNIDKSINEIVAEMTSYHLIKDKIELADNNSFSIDTLATVFNCDEINQLDGIKFIWKKEHKWVHIRKSNTEPIVRVFAEAETQEDAIELVNYLKNSL